MVVESNNLRAWAAFYGGAMSIDVSIQVVKPRLLAAVRRDVLVGQVANVWKPALDLVWAFLREHPGLRTDGRNIFLYHHSPNRKLPMQVDFGVEVVQQFERTGEVAMIETPAGRVASALHVGPYERMGETHEAIHKWIAGTTEMLAGKSWEIYGDWTEDVTKLEVRIEYLLW